MRPRTTPPFHRDWGTAFKKELRQLMRLVATMPTAWPPSGKGTRKCLVSRFPYLVIYAT